MYEMMNPVDGLFVLSVGQKIKILLYLMGLA